MNRATVTSQFCRRGSSTETIADLVVTVGHLVYKTKYLPMRPDFVSIVFNVGSGLELRLLALGRL